MQQELNRIRSKDFSHLDERLYNNLGMTSELDQTIAQLAELQKYLKSQIDSIEDEGQKQAAVRASQIAILELSTVRHNRCQEMSRSQKTNSCQCKHHFTAILQKVQKLNKAFKNTKQFMKREIRNCVADVSEIVSDNIQYFNSISNRKLSESTKLKNQISSLQTQVATLKQQNADLSRKLAQWQDAQKRLKLRRQKHQSQSQNQPWSQYNSNAKTNKTNQQVNNIYMNTTSEHHRVSANVHFQQLDAYDLGSCTDRYTVYESNNQNTMYRERQFKSMQTLDCEYIINNETPRLPMPLRRQSSAKKQSQEGFKSCQNSIILQEQRVNMTRTAKNSPCHNSKQLTNSPTSKLKQKQNQILRLKGMKEVNRKSTRKLKLISMI